MIKHVNDIVVQAQRLYDFAEHNDTVALDHELGKLEILIHDARDAIDAIWREARSTMSPLRPTAAAPPTLDELA